MYVHIYKYAMYLLPTNFFAVLCSWKNQYIISSILLFSQLLYPHGHVYSYLYISISFYNVHIVYGTCTISLVIHEYFYNMHECIYAYCKILYTIKVMYWKIIKCIIIITLCQIPNTSCTMYVGWIRHNNNLH